jgi:amino acid transporter
MGKSFFGRFLLLSESSPQDNSPPESLTLLTRMNTNSNSSGDDSSSSHASYGTPPLLKESDTCSVSSDVSMSSRGQQQAKHGTLGVLPLAAIIFYSVSGGPFGVEESIRAAGPFYTLLGFCIAPFVFSLPECLMTAELSAGGFHSSAAGCAWVEEAFGRHMGFLEGYLTWVAGATDNAIYPVLFLEYALQVFPNEDMEDVHSITRFLVVTGISLGLVYLNWLGLDLVGNMSMLVCCVAMSPFVFLVIFGASKVEPDRWFVTPNDLQVADMVDQASSDDLQGGFFPNIVLSGVILRPFLNNLFWNFNSFDSAGSFSEDTKNPAQVLPKAMFLALGMVFFGYIIPLLVALGVTDAPPAEWVDGYLATVSVEAVGPWLGKLMIFAAALSNIGQFQAELSSDAYMLMGMAERGYLPKCFAIRSANGTPTYSLLLGAAVIVIMGLSNLESLIEMLNFNYALALLLEYAAFLKLRVSKSDGTCG